MVEPNPAPLYELRARVDELAGRVVEPDTAPLDALRESVRQLQELAAATVPDEMVAGLEARVAGLEQVAAGMPAEDLRTEVQRLTESTVVECQSLVQVLSARVDEIATSVPPEQDLLELRSRIDELAARPTGDQGLQARISELSTRLDDLGRLEPAVADIQTSLAGLDTARAEDAAATAHGWQTLRARSTRSPASSRDFGRASIASSPTKPRGLRRDSPEPRAGSTHWSRSTRELRRSHSRWSRGRTVSPSQVSPPSFGRSSPLWQPDRLSQIRPIGSRSCPGGSRAPQKVGAKGSTESRRS